MAQSLTMLNIKECYKQKKKQSDDDALKAKGLWKSVLLLDYVTVVFKIPLHIN